jgi:quinol monooxygenase YgiN
VPLQVVATITAKPGTEEIVRDALADLVSGARTEEGCLVYELFQSAADPTVFITVETWRGQEDLDAHLQMPHMKQAFAIAGEHLAGAPVIHPLNPIA